MCSTYLSNLLKLNWKVYPKLAFCSKSILVSFFCGTYFGECSNCSFQYKESIVPSTKNLLKPFNIFFLEKQTKMSVIYWNSSPPPKNLTYSCTYSNVTSENQCQYLIRHEMPVMNWHMTWEWINDDLMMSILDVILKIALTF